MELTARDREILKQVFTYRLLTREQIETLLFPPTGGQDHFTKTSKARMRLKLLFHHGYVERIPMFVGTAAWAWRPIYRLARKGAEIVAADLGVPEKKLAYWGNREDKDHRDSHVSFLFLEHALKINDVRIAVSIAARKAGYQVEKWLDDTTLKSQEMKDYVALPVGQGTRKVAVIPDAYFALNMGTRRAHFLLELDRATMTRQRWAIRILAYLTYIGSGKYTTRYQTRSLRILTVTTTEQRLMNLKETTRKTGGGDLFWFTTSDQISASSVFFDPIWRLANDERDSGRKSLLGQP